MIRKEYSKLARTFFQEGTELYEQKKFSEAENKLKKALTFLPSSEDIMYNLALVYLEQKKYDLAWEMVNRIKLTDCQNLIADLKKAEGRVEDISVKWLKFYTYVRIPLGILISINSFIQTLGNYSNNPSFIFYLPLISVDIIVAVFLFMGLHRRKLWGWKLNWFSLAFEVLTRPLVRASNLNEYLIISSSLIIIWFFPNFIYFKRRKTLFT